MAKGSKGGSSKSGSGKGGASKGSGGPKGKVVTTDLRGGGAPSGGQQSSTKTQSTSGPQPAPSGSK